MKNNKSQKKSNQRIQAVIYNTHFNKPKLFSLSDLGTTGISFSSSGTFAIPQYTNVFNTSLNLNLDSELISSSDCTHIISRISVPRALFSSIFVPFLIASSLLFNNSEQLSNSHLSLHVTV